ncbi:MAG: hybrid sensor histidine kinase/response regulator [Acidimicrobiales bacterium]
MSFESNDAGLTISEAIRRSQRIASQLHQLVATSITTSGSLEESDILLAIAGRARAVFDCDEALVSVAANGVVRSALASRTSTELVDGDTERPQIAETVSDARLVRGWLTVPILEGWIRAQGLIAIRHANGSPHAADDGEILTLLAQMTASAVAEARLREGIRSREARWRALVNSAPVGIVDVTREGQVLWWNRAAARTLAWPEAVSDAPAPAFSDEVSDQMRGLLAEAALDRAVRGEVTINVAERRRELRVSVTALARATGEPEHLLVLVDDVTDEHEMQAELRQARGGEIRAQVASSIAHDFNNLLTLISGYAEMLTGEVSANEGALDLVRDIQATTSRASQITQQLQTIGRTQSREATVVDVRRLIESNAEVIERIVGGAVTVTREFDELAGNVLVDADQFEQVILNLVINARDAMPEGGDLVLRVAAEADGDEEWVVIGVADTGTGMDEATLRRCFEPFFTTKGPFKGTGMGLASARRLIEASGGTIHVTSRPGVGTSFEIRLPATRDSAAVEALATSVTSASTGTTVLVAEDDEALRRLMVQVLRRNGYRVLEGDNGASALEAARASAVDALVTDVDMPVMGGVELAVTLQARTPSLAVLVVSGHADASVLADLTPRTGAFLAKPFRPSELVDRLNELLARSRA